METSLRAVTAGPSKDEDSWVTAWCFSNLPFSEGTGNISSGDGVFQVDQFPPSDPD